MKALNVGIVLSGLIVLGGCQSTKQIENTFDPAALRNSTDLTFSSPNLSSLHAPPIQSGFAYIETFEKSSFCKSNVEFIGKVTITKANKTQFTKIPTGKVIAKIGYYSRTAIGHGFDYKTYYSLIAEPTDQYEIILTEARPLITGFSVEILATTSTGLKKTIPFKKGKTRKEICAL